MYIIIDILLYKFVKSLKLFYVILNYRKIFRDSITYKYVMKQHRGEILEQAIRNSNMSLSVISKKIHKSRQYLYNLFENPNIQLDTLIEIGEVIHYDFSKDVQELKKANNTSDETDSTVNFWKDRYLELLEKYNLLLEQSLLSKNKQLKS